MFWGCTSLTTAPDLMATTLPVYCYQNMFDGCSSLNSIKVGFSDWQRDPSLSVDPTENWVNGVAASGTFTCSSGLTQTKDSSHIPSGWTVNTF